MRTENPSDHIPTRGFRGMTIRGKLAALVGFFVIGFVGFCLFTFFVFEKVKVGGPVYRELTDLREVVADYLPPPEYIIEAHLLSHQMASLTNRDAVAPLIERGRVVRAEFEERHRYWMEKLPPGDLKRAAVETSFNSAVSYFDTRDATLIPAVLAGDFPRARSICDTDLERLFKEHRAAIDTVIRLSTERIAATEVSTASYVQTRMSFTVLFAVVTIMAVLAISAAIVFSISRPLAKTVTILENVAQGDLSSRIKVRTRDEIGRMGLALNEALDRMSTAVRTMAENARSLAESSDRLTEVGQQISANAEETSTQANVVSTASELVNSNVHTVSAAVEEMGVTIKEIAKNASEAAKVAASAVKLASTTNATVSQLGRSSVEIGSVIKVITSIAEQTNLLALNATIEAARAGEAGKGFAVVANEVKELAKQTARATEEIGRKVETIQNDTNAAVAAIEQVGHTISEISDYQSTIASAVEEQTAATNEMIRNISEAARGTSDITANIQAVAQAARDTNEGVCHMHTAATDLTRMAETLETLVGEFVCDSEPIADRTTPARPAWKPESANPPAFADSGHAVASHTRRPHVANGRGVGVGSIRF